MKKNLSTLALLVSIIWFAYTPSHISVLALLVTLTADLVQSYIDSLVLKSKAYLEQEEFKKVSAFLMLSETRLLEVEKIAEEAKEKIAQINLSGMFKRQ